MKINHECIRSLLLYLENNLTINKKGINEPIKIKSIIDNNELNRYSPEDIYFSALKLVEGKYIAVKKIDIAPKLFIITDITMNGYDYLNTIRDPIIWSKVKKKAGDLSNIAIEVLKVIAIGAAKELLL